MTSRRDLLGLFCLAPLAARAQQPRKVYRVGVLETSSLQVNAENFERFRQGLKERGYVEGPNLVILYRSADGRNERFTELAQELVRLKADLILTRGTPATEAARKASSSIPIVMAAVADPVEMGFAASLAKPGGNVTGLTTASSELVPKRLELIKALVPKAAQIAVYTNLSNAAATATWHEIEVAASNLSLRPQLLDVRAPEQIEAAFETAVRQRADALIIGIDNVNRKLIIELAARHRLPAMYSAREFVHAGGLVSYGVSYPDLYYRAAGYADRILKGAKPAEMAIERPAKFELHINRRTAHTLDLAIPPDLFLKSDRLVD